MPAPLNMTMMLNLSLLSLIIPLWMIGQTDGPAWLVSALLLVNTVSVVFQVRIARRVSGLRSAARAARLAGILMLVRVRGLRDIREPKWSSDSRPGTGRVPSIGS